MSLEATLTEIVARLRQGRFPFVCLPELACPEQSRREGSLSVPIQFRLHPFLRGWLVPTNLNNILKRTIIKLAAEVAGLNFGKSAIAEF